MHKFGIFCLFILVSGVFCIDNVEESISKDKDFSLDNKVEGDNNEDILDYLDLDDINEEINNDEYYIDNNDEEIYNFPNRKLLVNIKRAPVKKMLKEKKLNITIDTKNINEYKNISSFKLNNLKEKVENMLVEIIKKETESMNSILYESNKTSESVKNSFNEYQKSREKLLKIRNNIRQLNRTISEHYSQMKKDTDYLKRLENIRPGFLKSLDNVNSLISQLEKTIHNEIVDSDEKTKLKEIIFDLKNVTQYSTNDLAKKFLDHYEKYKKHYNQYKISYINTTAQLDSLLKQYNNEKLIVSGFYKEYTRILEIFKKLQLNYKYSKADLKLMRELFKNLKTILSGTNSKCIANNLKSTNPDHCSIDLLKSHIKNNLV